MNTEESSILDVPGWVITSEHDEENSNRVGYGQRLKQAEQTEASFEAVFGRTIYMANDLTVNDIPYDKRVKWRSFSDDGDPAYSGVVHIDWLFPSDEYVAALKEADLYDDEDEALGYNIDRFCMSDWGATRVAYNGSDIRRCRPDLADHVAQHTICHFTPNTTYFEIYG